MKKKVLFITIGVSIAAIAAAVITPIVIVNNLNKKDSKPAEKSITFTFDDISMQGPREEGGSYWELSKLNGSPTGKTFGTRREYVDDQWVYHSYVNGYNYYSIGEHIVTIFEDTSIPTPNTTFHFEFLLTDDAIFTGAYLEGHFYTNRELSEEKTKISYKKEDMKEITILESINEYYQIVLDKIVFTYTDL